jgi:hypothetical protein
MFMKSVFLVAMCIAQSSVINPALAPIANLNGLNGVVSVTAKSPFCAQSKDAGEATGQEQKNGGNMCVSTVQGVIPDVSVMISTLITQPASGAQLSASRGFQVNFQTKNLMAGNFVKLDSQFLLSPQTVDPRTGMVQGFMQLSIQQIPTNGQAPKGNQISFFAALSDESNANGLTNFKMAIPAGQIKTTGPHRICTISAAASGQPVIMAVAQRGAQDDCIRVNIDK